MFISTHTFFLVSKFPQALVALVNMKTMEKIKIQTVMIKHSNSELEVLKSFPNSGGKKKPYKRCGGNEATLQNKETMQIWGPFTTTHHKPPKSQIG
jgi:hypothetical protein